MGEVCEAVFDSSPRRKPQVDIAKSTPETEHPQHPRNLTIDNIAYD